jgi:polysaccharide chain length determinant protein (PEP-CTERM system associated)
MNDELEDQPSRSFHEYWAIVRRRGWWILLASFACWVVLWGGSWLLPSTYQSEALILVEPQKVPDQYVVPNVTVNLQDRLQSMTQQILSRTRLQATINRFGLYSKHHGLSSMLKSKDPIDQMRNDIKIELVESPAHPGELAAFKISYFASSPKLAEQVNGELTSLFIEENVKAQELLSENTTAFLENQLTDARAKMEEQEAKVAAFKEMHTGGLPSQEESNVQILAGLQSQLQNTQHALDAAKQQKLYLESLFQQYESVQANLGAGDLAMSPEMLDKQLTDLRLHLADLRSQFTDDYPDVVSVKEQIDRLKKQIEEQIATSDAASKNLNSLDPTKRATAPTALPELPPGSPTPMIQIQSQLKVNQLEVQNDQQHEKEIETQIAAYQSRLNSAPQTEQALAEVSRGYDESKSNYDSLLQKQLQSQLATNLEQRQQGEQFRVVDPPSLPDKPVAQNHFIISLGGLVLGIAVGIGLAAFLEVTDLRIREEKDLEGLVSARVLVGIPRLSTPREDRLHLVVMLAKLGAAAAIVFFIVVGNLYAYYKG